MILNLSSNRDTLLARLDSKYIKGIYSFVDNLNCKGSSQIELKQKSVEFTPELIQQFKTPSKQDIEAEQILIALHVLSSDPSYTEKRRTTLSKENLSSLQDVLGKGGLSEEPQDNTEKKEAIMTLYNVSNAKKKILRKHPENFNRYYIYLLSLEHEPEEIPVLESVKPPVELLPEPVFKKGDRVTIDSDPFVYIITSKLLIKAIPQMMVKEHTIYNLDDATVGPQRGHKLTLAPQINPRVGDMVRYKDSGGANRTDKISKILKSGKYVIGPVNQYELSNIIDIVRPPLASPSGPKSGLKSKPGGKRTHKKINHKTRNLKNKNKLIRVYKTKKWKRKI